VGGARKARVFGGAKKKLLGSRGYRTRFGQKTEDNSRNRKKKSATCDIAEREKGMMSWGQKIRQKI